VTWILEIETYSAFGGLGGFLAQIPLPAKAG
jgi:hypothetical protein